MTLRMQPFLGTILLLTSVQTFSNSPLTHHKHHAANKQHKKHVHLSHHGAHAHPKYAHHVAHHKLLAMNYHTTDANHHMHVAKHHHAVKSHHAHAVKKDYSVDMVQPIETQQELKSGKSSEGGFVSLFAGPGWSHDTKGGRDVQTRVGGFTNNYFVDDANRFAPFWGGDAGYIWRHIRGHDLNIGVGAESGYSRFLSPAGTVQASRVTEEISVAEDTLLSALPELIIQNTTRDTLQFRYAVQSIPVFFISTLQFPFERVVPYLIGGLGVSWNRAYDYVETPVAGRPSSLALAIGNQFSPHSEESFAYTVGAGASWILATLTDIGIEYRYTNFGAASLAAAPTQTTNNRLPLGDIHSHAVLLRLSYGLG